MKIRYSLFVLIVISLLLNALYLQLPGNVLVASAGSTAKPNTTNLQVTNKSTLAVVLQLTGPRRYSITLAPDETRTVPVEKGAYEYSYRACGGELKGELSIPPVKKFSTIKCEMVNVILSNQTGYPMTLQLKGPGVYSYTFPAGKTKIVVYRGSYDFVAHSDYCIPGGITRKGKYRMDQGTVWFWGCQSNSNRPAVGKLP